MKNDHIEIKIGLQQLWKEFENQVDSEKRLNVKMGEKCPLEVREEFIINIPLGVLILPQGDTWVEYLTTLSVCVGDKNPG